mmetsp:Transcript_166/g.501  ORF Transcript_166/g.501 Transcript_166/m.501 type:complete len:204 (-) Transcript_166:541-1152(-)
MFAFRAPPTDVSSSLDSETPTRPAPSSHWKTARYAWSSCAACTRTLAFMVYLARHLAARDEVRRMAAPPTRKSVFDTSMDRLSPRYQFWVMFSVDRTTAFAPRCTCSRSAAKSMEMRPAEQPCPDRLKERTDSRSLNLLTIIDASDGVGLKREQLMMRMSTSRGLRPVLASRPAKTVPRTSSASARASSMPMRGGSSKRLSGK